MFKKLPIIALVALMAAACEPEDPFQISEQPSDALLIGAWVGSGEITSPNDIGSNVNLGDQDRGFSFPVVINLRADRTFTLTTANFPEVVRGLPTSGLKAKISGASGDNGSVVAPCSSRSSRAPRPLPPMYWRSTSSDSGTRSAWPLETSIRR